jgi:hypothetical protein
MILPARLASIGSLSVEWPVAPITSSTHFAGQIDEGANQMSYQQMRLKCDTRLGDIALA